MLDTNAKRELAARCQLKCPCPTPPPPPDAPPNPHGSGVVLTGPTPAQKVAADRARAEALPGLTGFNWLGFIETMEALAVKDGPALEQVVEDVIAAVTAGNGPTPAPAPTPSAAAKKPTPVPAAEVKPLGEPKPVRPPHDAGE